MSDDVQNLNEIARQTALKGILKELSILPHRDKFIVLEQAEMRIAADVVQIANTKNNEKK